MDERFTVELTPLARFHLLQMFTSYPGPFKSPTESKAFRCVFDKLGLRAIQRVAERTGGQLSARQVNSTEPSSFVLSFDEMQALRSVVMTAAGKRNGALELVLGPLADDLDAILDGTERSETTAPMLDSATEDWTPPKVANAQPEQNG